MNGRLEPSDYCDGLYNYWVGLIDGQPYSLIMSIIEKPGEKRPKLKEDYISQTGTTYGLDFCIGNRDFLSQGLAAPTLKTFVEFFKVNVDSVADTFLIDPYDNNPRAKHVYAKAGFELVGDFIAEHNDERKKAYLLVKKI